MTRICSSVFLSLENKFALSGNLSDPKGINFWQRTLSSWTGEHRALLDQHAGHIHASNKTSSRSRFMPIRSHFVCAKKRWSLHFEKTCDFPFPCKYWSHMVMLWILILPLTSSTALGRNFSPPLWTCFFIYEMEIEYLTHRVIVKFRADT